MSNQQSVAPRASANGFGPRRSDRERDNKSHSSKSAGMANGGKLGHTSPSRDRLIYVMTYLIGHRVEVHVKNGSIISGIFHSSNTDKDLGIVLKMAQITKDGSAKGQKALQDIVKKPQIMVIPARELVQVIAKDVGLTSEELTSGNQTEKKKDLMIDSLISHSHHVEERELERWAPDEEPSEFLELENIYGRRWTRNWDQFETNETLFGVKSTFNEELYTTKLERGPHMREIEKQALRIAKEIEDEDTDDLHLAEERGVQFDENLEIDEEKRYSAVSRDIDNGVRFQSIMEKSNSNTNSNTCDSENTDALASTANTTWSSNEQLDLSTSSSLEGEGEATSHSADASNLPIENSTDFESKVLTSDSVANKPESVVSETRLEEKQIKDLSEQTKENIHAETIPSSEESKPSLSEEAKRVPPSGASGPAVTGKVGPTTELANHASARPSSSASNASERIGASSASTATPLSRSSSVASLSSEKSTLNPNAKEFKLNPNAKSFTPSSSLKPATATTNNNVTHHHAAVPDTQFYYATNIAPAPPMPGMHMIAPAFGGQQPYIYNPQGAPQMQSPQPFMQPNPPMYGQQMIIGQMPPRPAYYMPPTYTMEMQQQYRGRTFQ